MSFSLLYSHLRCKGIKGIGGSGVKKWCLIIFKDLNEPELLRFTECQNLISFKSYHNFNVRQKCNFKISHAKWFTPFNFCLKIYERPYQISEIEIVITFEQNLILTFCKKQQFRLIEIFENNQTSFFDPDPPYRLKHLL